MKLSGKTFLKLPKYIRRLIIFIIIICILSINPYSYRIALQYCQNNALRKIIFFVGMYVVRYCPFLNNKKIKYLGKTFVNWNGNSYLYQFLYLNQTYEYSIYRYMISKLQSGNVLIDVGANEGFFPILCSDLLGKYGKSYAIEANPENVKLMHQNIRENDIHNIVTISGALFKKKGKGILYNCHTNKMWSSINKAHPDCLSYSKNNISMYTLDDMVLHYNIDISKIKIIKIDVEGGELNVLHGAKKLINSCKADWIIEVNLRAYTLQEILDFFPSHNLKYFPKHYELYFGNNDSYTKPVNYTGTILNHTFNMIFTLD